MGYENDAARVNGYEAQVPDTLDLAERAALAVNALTGAADPEKGYETAACATMYHRPAHLSYRGGATCHPKVVHVLPQMRIMSGSTLRADYDEMITEWAVNRVEDDGLWWITTDDHPWDQPIFHEDTNCACAHNRQMVALMDRYRLDGNERWLGIVERMAAGRARILNWSEDGERAWSFYYLHREGWAVDRSGCIAASIDSHKPSQVEPAYPDIWTNGLNLRAFSRWYALSGDPQALKCADGLARFMKKAFRGEDAADWPSMIAGREHGFWGGHFHMHVHGMIGLAEYAIATGDPDAARHVRDFYEYARLHGIARMGFFPAIIGTLEYLWGKCRHIGGEVYYGAETGEPCEGCGIGDMVYLATLMSEAGLADYWEDVDQYVRNQLVEHQWVDRKLMESVVMAHGELELNPEFMVADEGVLDRLVGGFSSITDPTWNLGWYTQCCNANVPHGMYKAWSAIIRPQGDGVQVNLLLNRASEWMDIDSYLPYEGKVVLKNKTARSASVRIPRWVNRSKVRCSVSGVERPNVWLNNYLLIPDLSPADVVTIEFPMVETVERYTEKVYETEFTLQMKGNTVVDISPRRDRPYRIADVMDDQQRFAVNTGYPIYQRDHYRAHQAPLKTVERYVAPKVI